MYTVVQTICLRCAPSVPYRLTINIIHIIYVWYPWYIRFTSGIHYTHFLQLVSLMHNFYEWYAIFMSGIDNAQYFCLLSLVHDICACCPWYAIFYVMMHIVCVWYSRYTFFLSGIHGTHYLCLDLVADFVYCASHPINFSPIELWSTCHSHVKKSVTTTSLCPVLCFIPNFITIGQKVWPPCHTLTDRHTRTKLCILIKSIIL